jgi:serine phosphatase RsbU (regulator of sigma subunit)
MINSFRFWLISAFSTVLLICLIAIGLFISSLNTSKKLEEYHSVLKTTRILLLETNNLKEDIFLREASDSGFYAGASSGPEQKFKTLNHKMTISIRSLEKSEITVHNGLQGAIDSIKTLLVRYNRNYDELIYLHKLKGFKDYGLEGTMRNYAHFIFDKGNRDVQFYCLMLRRHEKDFLLRKDLNYVFAFSALVRKLIGYIHDSKTIQPNDKNRLITAIYFYNKYFKLLARIDNKIGIKGKSGYLNRSKQSFDEMANRIEQTDNRLKLLETDHKERLHRNTILVLIVLVAFLVSTIIILTQLISKSIRSISASFNNYVNSGFNYDSIVYKRSNIKEFNSILISFIKMAKEINIFTNFFREKVHERTLAINQQKDEILSQQLQIQDQYQVLLLKNNQLNDQKQLLARKNEETQQSLRYARRIQKAIQPGSSKFKAAFADSFVFSKARDVISGDFYLIYKDSYPAGDIQHHNITVVASDCTGHGVPGAIMSVLGINTINKLVKELKNSDPGKILNLLDKDISQVLSHDKKETDIVADGMDIAVFSFDTATYLLRYSIAKFSYYLVRDSELISLETQKSSIGYSFFNGNVKNFQTSEIQLQEGDCLYLLSDGFADQFGGPFNKKYKRNNIKNLIRQIHRLPMAEQKQIFRQEFTTWKRSSPQMDDVLVIGIRF